MKILVFFACFWAFSNAQSYRLPSTVRPETYTVFLEPDFVTDTFEGTVHINFTVTSATNNITLHARDLDFSNSTFAVLASGSSVHVANTSHSNDDRHFLYIYLNSTLATGSGFTLRIESFRGILNRDDEGFYLARYTDPNGNIRKLGTTQFQPTAARRAFPCFDEPALKAYFQINLIRSANYTSIANTELDYTTQLSENRFQDSYQWTRNVMSTYLVAFLVCDFTYVVDGDHRVYSRPAFTSQGRGSYSLSQSRPMLDKMAEFIGIPYTWGKMDHVGIPDGYFWAGAMENWGLVTYRETLILYSSNVSTAMNRQNIILIMGHEFGHMWFGNLVSPEWWTYIWLNEGFASYFDYFGPSLVEPDMHMIEQFTVRHTQNALRQDSSVNTRPMRTEVETPSEILSLFNYVVYSKAGAVIKMMEDVMTTEVFRAGNYIYLNNQSYGVAESFDLYNSWQQVVDSSGINNLPQNESIASVMLTWELNPGYPIVTVTRNYLNGTVELSQRRFIDSNPNNTDPSLWMIPITYSTPTRLNFSQLAPAFWLTAREQSGNIPSLVTSDWIVLNNQQSGYYRVNYDTRNWELIISQLRNGTVNLIHRNNRAQLLDDVFALARFGVVTYSLALDFSLYLSRETDFIVLFPFFQTLSFLEPHLQNSNVTTSYRNHIFSVLNTVYTTVGLNEGSSDDHLTRLNRQNTLHWLCRFGDLTCRFHALTSIRSWRDNNVLVPPTLQTVYACSALRVGTQADWNFLYGLYVTSEFSVQERMLPALGCAENPAILENYLNIILAENSTILEADKLTAIAGIHGAGSFGLDYFFGYLTSNYGRFRARFTDAQLTSMMNTFATRLTTYYQLETLQILIWTTADSELFTSAVTTVQNNVAWSNQYLPSISSWLTG